MLNHLSPLSIVPQGSNGVRQYQISGFNGAVGTAYVFVSMQQRLYITFQFQCNYLFSTVSVRWAGPWVLHGGMAACTGV